MNLPPLQAVIAVKTLIMEDYLILQICRVKLQEALDSGRKEEMVESLKYSSGMLPFSVAQNGVEETRVIIYGNHARPERLPFEYLDELSARWNVQGFIVAIDKEFTYVQYRRCREPFERCRAVFERDVVWRSDDVLYGQGSRVLDVEGFLKVCGYAVKVGEAFAPSNELFDEACAALSVFKGLELVLGNRARYCAVPQIQMIHLANDFLIKAVKPSLKHAEHVEHGESATGLSELVDLAVDFFSAK